MGLDLQSTWYPIAAPAMVPDSIDFPFAQAMEYNDNNWPSPVCWWSGDTAAVPRGVCGDRCVLPWLCVFVKLDNRDDIKNLNRTVKMLCWNLISLGPVSCFFTCTTAAVILKWPMRCARNIHGEPHRVLNLSHLDGYVVVL